MKFVFDELYGLDILKKNRKRSDLRKYFGDSYREFPKAPFSKNSTDVFGGSVIKVWYEVDDTIEGIQVYHPEAEFYYYKNQLLGVSVKDLKSIFSSLGEDLFAEEDGSGFNARNNRVRFYVPDLEELNCDAKVECVYVDISSNS